MDIFGRHIFGKDAQEFIDLCFESQVEYIEKYTTQRDKEQIKVLLSNLALDKDECLDCKKQRENYGNNISSEISKEVAISNEQASTGADDERNSAERPKVKRTKNKRVPKG